MAFKVNISKLSKLAMILLFFFLFLKQSLEYPSNLTKRQSVLCLFGNSEFSSRNSVVVQIVMIFFSEYFFSRNVSRDAPDIFFSQKPLQRELTSLGSWRLEARGETRKNLLQGTLDTDWLKQEPVPAKWVTIMKVKYPQSIYCQNKYTRNR